MGYDYEFTEDALKDVDDVVNYIVNKLCNVSAAKKLIDDIENTILNIIKFPYSYPNSEYYYIKDNTIRHAIIKNYIMFYKINENKIIILRFKHSKQNKML